LVVVGFVFGAEHFGFDEIGEVLEGGDVAPVEDVALAVVAGNGPGLLFDFQ
jgi:hypothetical protein